MEAASVTLLMAFIVAQSYATATAEVRVEVRPDIDNAPALQNLLDTAVDGSVVTLPKGVWNVSTALRINKPLTMVGNETTIRLIANNKADDVVRIGDWGKSVRVNAVTLRRLTLEVAGVHGIGTYNCVDFYSEDLTCEACEFIGSPNEGVYGNGRRPKFVDCIARNIGNGNQTYSLPLSAYNSHAADTLILRCKAYDCGFFAEMSGNGSKCLYSEAINSAGINVGSATYGTNDVEIGWFKGAGVGFSNGNGRLANINVHDCFLTGGSSFTGGLFENLAHDPYFPEGPAVGTSRFERNTFIVSTQHQGVLGANTGPAAGTWDHDADPNTPPYHEMGREHVIVSDNTFFFTVQVNDSPTMYVGGNYTGPLEFKRNKFLNMDNPPSRGDIATFSNNANKAIPGQPNLVLEGNIAVRRDGTERPLVVKVEGK